MKDGGVHRRGTRGGCVWLGAFDGALLKRIKVYRCCSPKIALKCLIHLAVLVGIAHDKHMAGTAPAPKLVAIGSPTIVCATTGVHLVSPAQSYWYRSGWC